MDGNVTGFNVADFGGLHTYLDSFVEIIGSDVIVNNNGFRVLVLGGEFDGLFSIFFYIYLLKKRKKRKALIVCKVSELRKDTLPKLVALLSPQDMRRSVLYSQNFVSTFIYLFILVSFVSYIQFHLMFLIN